MSRRIGWSIALSLLVIGWVTDRAMGQENSPLEGLRLSASPMGIRRFTPGEWNAVIVHGINQTDQEATGTISVYFDKESQYQYARRMWLPPKSMRSTWLPIRAPQQPRPGTSSFEMTLMPLAESGGQEVLRRREYEELLPTALVSADMDAITTGAFYRRIPSNGAEAPIDIDQDAYEMMAVARETAEYPRIILELPWDFVPPNSAMWQSLDQFLLCGDRILSDTAGLAALRDWLFRGGRLCVFLDRTSPETVAAVLGHGDSFRVVDRVELNEFTIEERGTIPGLKTTDRRLFEKPIELVRVAVENADVQCRVNGWPAAFWLPAGEGEVLCMALAPDGWRPAPILPGWESLPEHRNTDFRGLNNVQAIATRFYVARRADPNLESVTRSVLQQQIGYKIPGRGLATGLLGLNVLGLVAGGIWLARRNQLDRMAYLLPIVTLAVAGIFIRIGSANNRSVPASVAYTQLVRHHPEIDAAHVTGTSGLYQHENRPLSVSAGENGLLVPRIMPVDGTTQRLIWADSNSGEWPNVQLPAGSVQFATFQQAVRVDHHVEARGSFRANGFEGRVEGLQVSSNPDALVASNPAPNSSVQIQSDGTFRITRQEVLAGGQFLAGTVVSDVSRRRQELFRSLLTQPDESRFATRPTLLVWTEPSPRVLRIPADLTESGSSLAAIPLLIDRTPPATDFTIPPTFIHVTTAAGEQGLSLAYDSRNGRWLANASRATNTRLRFQLPRSVLPCQVKEAQLTIRLNAPSRKLLVHGVVDNKDTLIKPIENPSGVYEITVDRPEWLQLDDRGGLLFTFEITEAEQELARQETVLRNARDADRRRRGEIVNDRKDGAGEFSPVTTFSTWEISYVRLAVRGTTH